MQDVDAWLRSRHPRTDDATLSARPAAARGPLEPALEGATRL
jgi:hypothetical protein